MSVTILLAVGAGGMLGAILRYSLMHWTHLSLHWHPALGTMGVNILGSFAIGLFTALLHAQTAIQAGWQPAVKAFLLPGLLGGFTTFSTFALESLMIEEQHAFSNTLLYVTASVLLSIMAAYAGLLMGGGGGLQR